MYGRLRAESGHGKLIVAVIFLGLELTSTVQKLIFGSDRNPWTPYPDDSRQIAYSNR